MSWRFGNYDAATGVRKDYRHDGNGGIEVRISQDVAPHIEANKAMANHNDGYSKSRELRRAAHIPDSVRLKWLLEEGVDWMMHDRDPDVAKWFAKKLNSSEWMHLRTAPGVLSVSGGIMR